MLTTGTKSGSISTGCKRRSWQTRRPGKNSSPSRRPIGWNSTAGCNGSMASIPATRSPKSQPLWEPPPRGVHEENQIMISPTLDPHGWNTPDPGYPNYIRPVCSDDETDTCCVCFKPLAKLAATPTCHGTYVCHPCDNRINRADRYVKPTKSPAEKAHDRLYKAYQQGKALPELTARFTFPSEVKGQDPVEVRGVLTDRMCRALQGE